MNRKDPRTITTAVLFDDLTWDDLEDQEALERKPTPAPDGDLAHAMRKAVMVLRESMSPTAVEAERILLQALGDL
jgi:hypothetical protein